MRVTITNLIDETSMGAIMCVGARRRKPLAYALVVQQADRVYPFAFARCRVVPYGVCERYAGRRAGAHDLLF